MDRRPGRQVLAKRGNEEVSAEPLLPFGLLPVLLAAEGEGRAFLDQLGIVFQDRPDRAKDDLAIYDGPTTGPRDSEHVRAVIVGIQAATHRVTFVADHPQRESAVFFLAANKAIGISFGAGGFTPAVLNSDQVPSLLGEAVAAAEHGGVHWSVARWRGGVRQAAAREHAGDVVVGAVDQETRARLASAGDLASMVAAIVG